MAQIQIGTSRVAQATSGAAVNANFTELFSRASKFQSLGVTAATNFVVPAGYMIENVVLAGTNANAVNGGLKFGTTSGAADVIAAEAVAGNSIHAVTNANLLKRVFSKTAPQTVYIDAVTGWASASVDILVIMRKVYE